MEVGIVGAGAIARALAGHLARAGQPFVLSNSRGPGSLADLAAQLGSQARAGSVAEAAGAEIVALALPWPALGETLPGLPWEGRIVVDATNPVASVDPFALADLGGRTSGEAVAALAPGARLVEAANTLPAAVLAGDPQVGEGRRVLFISGDDPGAKGEVAALLARLGFAAVDLGGLRAGGALQELGGPLSGLDMVSISHE